MSSCATCGRGKKHFGLIDLPSEIKFLWRVASNACISTYLLRTHFRYTATSYPIYLLHPVPVPYVSTGSLFVKPVNKMSNIPVLHKRSEWWRVHPFDVVNFWWAFNSDLYWPQKTQTIFWGSGGYSSFDDPDCQLVLALWVRLSIGLGGPLHIHYPRSWFNFYEAILIWP